jgi:hypothetical protein
MEVGGGREVLMAVIERSIRSSLWYRSQKKKRNNPGHGSRRMTRTIHWEATGLEMRIIESKELVVMPKFSVQ